MNAFRFAFRATVYIHPSGRARGREQPSLFVRLETAVPSTMRALALALASYILLTCVDATVKTLGGRYDVLQITFLNCVFAMLAILTVAVIRGDVRRLRPKRLTLHSIRGLVTVATTFATFWSYVHFPISQVYAILFTAPLLATALAAILLKEEVGRRQIGAIGFAFFGALLALDPFQVDFGWANIVPLAAAGGAALNMILLRRLGVDGETTESSGAIGNLFAIAAAPLLVPPVWVTPSSGDALLIVLAGLMTGSSFLLLAAAFQLAPASRVAPMQYVQIVFAVAADLLLFGHAPTYATLAGSALVVSSSILALWSGHGAKASRRRKGD